jgi:hypothetical protein
MQQNMEGSAKGANIGRIKMEDAKEESQSPQGRYRNREFIIQM